jgi:hypothetical protein
MAVYVFLLVFPSLLPFLLYFLHFLRKMWTIHLAFILFILCRVFFSFLTVSNASFFTLSVPESTGDVYIRDLMWSPQEEVHWCEVSWPGRPSHWPVPSNPVFVVSCGEMLLLKRISFPLSVRQKQPSGSNLVFLSAHVSLCYVVVGCVSRLLAVRLNIRSKFVQTTTSYFRILQWFCLISSLSQAQFDGP